MKTVKELYQDVELVKLPRTEVNSIRNHRDKAVAAKVCAWCGTDANEKGFVDELSIKEFKISGLCQSCQDETFGKPKKKKGTSIPMEVLRV